MLHDLIEKIRDGKGTPNDLKRLEELAVYVKDASLCGLGTSAPNPLISTLRYYREEYEQKMKPL